MVLRLGIEIGLSSAGMKSPDGRTLIRVRLGPVRTTWSRCADRTSTTDRDAITSGHHPQGPGFTEALTFVKAGAVKTIDETYTMLTGKRQDLPQLRQ